MLWSDKLKLNKQLAKSLTEAGFNTPKDIQLKTLARISGGQDIIAIAPRSSGKTTTCVLSALNKFKHTFDDAPRVLILVPAKEQVTELTEQFKLLCKNKTIKIVGLYAAPGLEAQLDALAHGADIVISTPDRARAIYLKLALNLNKIELLIIDDADLIVKQGLQLPVAELANSITKCQHLVFTEVMHSKLSSMIQPFMNNAATVEVELNENPKVATHEQVLYHVPNFRTKLNLLNLFLEDAELFTKVMVLVNSALTAETIYQSFKRPVKNETMLYKQQVDGAVIAGSINEFTLTGHRILLALNQAVSVSDIDSIPFIIHFELPDEEQTYIDRIIDHNPGESNEKINISLVTDFELNMVRKIELTTGVKIPAGELPAELKIETEQKPKRAIKPDTDESLSGTAFHAKKPANAKTYNYSSGEKARMNKKKKYG